MYFVNYNKLAFYFKHILFDKHFRQNALVYKKSVQFIFIYIKKRCHIKKMS